MTDPGSDSGGKIRVMPDTLASQVAAGEVVERPASVIKELVENSLDAGATHVTVSFARGGAANMRVVDDGCGMTAEDARMCLERHATSKLRDTDGLSTVMTMGFRGEAMPSVASVAKLRLTTAVHGSVSGTEILVEGGEVVSERDVGAAPGTAVEVRELFYSIPARRKFLKAESTEAAHIEHQVRLHALAYPGVRFTLQKDGRTVFDLPATQDSRVRIAALIGPAAMRDLVEVPEHMAAGVTVQGHMLKADHARSGRRHQFLFLNQRPVEDKMISAAIRDGFGSVVGRGLNPAVWLWLEMDAQKVDINVHPAKREVRFHREYEVRTAVTEAVVRALAPPPVEVAPAVDVVRDPSPKRAADVLAERLADKREAEAREEVAPVKLEKDERPFSLKSEGKSLIPPTRHEPVQPQLPATETQKPKGGHTFRLVGPLSDRYFVLEGEDGLVLLDPVSSAERVIYEQILGAKMGQGITTQGLLVPLILEVDERDKDVVLRHSMHFSTAGIDVSDFGSGVLQITGVPSFLKDVDAKKLLLEFIDELAETGGILRRDMAYERFAGKLAAVTARRRGFLSSEQAERLLDALFRCDLPFCGADGRPTLIQLSLQELDRRFRRK